jgi:asparagine N-glycosylation enzyme membrane subunit Stt3
MDETRKIKDYVLKDNYTLVLSVVSLICLFFVAVSFFNWSSKLGSIGSASSLISTSLWGLLLLSSIISLFFAYKERYDLIAIPFLIWLLIFTIQFRTANIPQLTDVTTGNYTLGPDLDPFLYLRNVYDINNGSIPKIDYMQYVPLGSPNYARSSLMPWTIFGVYKIISVFSNNISNNAITYAAIITPVILFIISLIGFFLFVRLLFSERFGKRKSSIIALIASIFYSISPQMLHRTTGGIPEIESLGMVFFWFAFLFFTLAWRSEKVNKQILFGVIAGLFTGLMSWSWGGYTYIYLILSLATFIIFFIDKDSKKNIIIFSSWLIISLIIEFTKVRSISVLINDFYGSGFAIGILALLIFQLILVKTKISEKIKKINLPLPLITLIIAIALLAIIFLITRPSEIVTIISNLIERFLYPYGKGRTGLTVAENKAPYLIDAFQEFGYILVTFTFSLILLFSDGLKKFNKKYKTLLVSSFIIILAGMLFSRYSSTSMFNGDNTISYIFYFLSLLTFSAIFAGIYIKSFRNKDEKTLEDFKNMDFLIILILSFSFFAIISIRGAIRLFFLISPIIIFISAPLPFYLFESKKRTKDELVKLIAIILIILTTIAFVYTSFQYAQSSIIEAKNTVPGIYEKQWQEAMKWVRDNTAPGSVFVHWWDYGYWVQTLGERPTVTDGGHTIGYWDHLIGRYLLTTPKPETALSFMKSHNVSYLLIDSTDLGKYGAYSSIGGDASGTDRYSWIPIMLSDQKQIKETNNSVIRIYQGGVSLDEDIVYNNGGNEIFLPKDKAGIAGVILEIPNSGALKQPEGVFVYNGNQVQIPIRYVYLNGQLIDFKEGVSSVLRIISVASTTSQGSISLDKFGGIVYLSPKVSQSLFSQLYLLNDPLKEYNTLRVADVTEDLLVSQLKQYANLNDDFVYYGGGFRGPIKIWKVDYPDNIIARDEFLRTSGEYAEFDNLTFTK